MDQIKARISPGYRWRLVLISLAMLGFGLYCVYDWRIGYPRMVEKYQAYEQVRADYPNTHPEVWPREARQRGWDPEPPKKKTDRDVFTQFLMACIVLPIGGYFLVKLFRENGRWVAMDDHGLTASGGRDIAWDQMQRLDETRWKTKGIAWLHYQGPTGQTRKLLLDDFKSEREPIKQIVQRVQQHLYPDRVADPVASDAPAGPPAPAVGEGAGRASAAEGQVYAEPTEDGQAWQIVKVLRIDEQAVHLRSYEARFDQPPAEVDTADLPVAIGHMPLAPDGFQPDPARLIATEPVTEQELEGYRIWAGEASA